MRISRRQNLQIRVLQSLVTDGCEECTFGDLKPGEWGALLRWLDIAGLALYFANRLSSTGLINGVPPAVQRRFATNLHDNRERMNALAEEVLAIHRAFVARGINYALLKGFSLAGHSVPSFELRSQLDADFLVHPRDLASARAVLESRGYHLHGRCGSAWEYKDEPIPRTSLRQLYQHTGSRVAEIHVAATPGREAQLAAKQPMRFRSELLPVLAPEDLFLGQALHLYKHLTADGARAAHLLELYRHIMYRRDDHAFWQSLHARTATEPDTRFALGFTFALITKAFGQFLPGDLSVWTSDQLRPFAVRWIDRFGLSTILGGPGGSKLSAILHDELAASGLFVRRPVHYVPLALPPRIERPRPGESLAQAMGRHARQVRFLLMRARFQFCAGIRLAYERKRWRATPAGTNQ